MHARPAASLLASRYGTKEAVSGPLGQTTPVRCHNRYVVIKVGTQPPGLRIPGPYHLACGLLRENALPAVGFDDEGRLFEIPLRGLNVPSVFKDQIGRRSVRPRRPSLAA